MDTVLFRHQNPAASMPLVVPYTVECNVSDDQIFANVLANSKRIRKWLKRSDAHNRTAILCGSGPSLADCMDELKYIKGDVFALNNAARYLYEHGIKADYQIIMDAQPRTIELVGPAWKHLFASMVDPTLFDLCPDAILWHASHGDLMIDEIDGFPCHAESADQAFLIGSGITVGNTSLPLLYAMGYRRIHIFGMDSCHRGTQAHVLRQSINDGDPCTIVVFLGKEYVCSFTMKLQADNFMQRATAIRDGGCAIQMHGDGYLQAIWRVAQGTLDEKTKYEIMWTMPEYRECGSPGEISAEDFIRIANPKPADTVLDLGCGPGRGGQAVRRLSGCRIIYVDIAQNSAAPDPFVVLDMSKDELPKADFGYCCDVMEHIPPEQVESVIANICRAVPMAFFRISLLDDIKGVLIGHKLHLSVHSASWWLEVLKKFGEVVMMHDHEVMAYFYVKSFTRE